MLEDLRFAGRLLTEPADMAPFLTDWRGRWTGRARAVAQPESAQDVAAVLAWCSAHGVPVLPQGGNTGLSGGSVPDGSGQAMVVSLARLNRIRAVDAAGNTLVAEAGCTLAAVQAAAAAVGRLFPLSLASQGSCSIGGNLATNAGGVHALRYGTARDLCLGLELATSSGALWDGLRTVRKNNTGLDLRDLFVGAEGTLGIITAAVLKLFPQPASQAVAWVAVGAPERALQLLGAAQAALGPGLTAFELISEACLQAVLRYLPQARRPLANASPWYVLVEASAWGAADAAAALLGLLEGEAAGGGALDATIAGSAAQAAALWALREAISDAQGAEGGGIKHDVALPVGRVAAFLERAEAAMARDFPQLRLGVFGHLGDGNVHFNVLPGAGAWSAGLEAAVNGCVHDLVRAEGGSISAEHGLGVLRLAEARRTLPAIEVAMMQAVRAALDPAGIMNPGKGL